MQPKLTGRSIQKIIFFLCCINLVFLIGTSVHAMLSNAQQATAGAFLVGFNLGYENVPAAWYSSMLHFLVAGSCVLCYVLDQQRFQSKWGKMLNAGWLFFALLFLTLSLDELGSFHETIGDSAMFQWLTASQKWGWYLFYFIVALAGLFMLCFGLLRLRKPIDSAVWLTLGVLFFLSNPVQEHYEIAAWRQAANSETWRRPVLFILLEEGSEIFGTLAFLLAMLRYYAQASKPHPSVQANQNLSFTQNATPQSINTMLILFLLTLGILFYFARQQPNQPFNYDSGIPKNWFPSVVACGVAVASFFSYRKSVGRNKLAWALLALVAVLLSAWSGGHLDQNYFKGYKLAKRFVYGFFACGLLYVAFELTHWQTRLYEKMIFLSAIFLIVLPFFKLRAHLLELHFIGFALLLVAVVNYMHQQPNLFALQKKSTAGMGF